MKLLIVFLLGIMSILFFLGTVVFSQESQQKFSIPVVFEYPGVDERDPFYPLIYDADKKICVFDEECPKPTVLYPDKEIVLKRCEEIKNFLEKQIELNIYYT